MEFSKVQAFFKNKFYELLLKKSLSLRWNQLDCFFELSEEGKDDFIMSLVYEDSKGFSSFFVEHLSHLEKKGLVIDRQKGQVILARKHDFTHLTPESFSLRCAQFFSEVLFFRKQIDEFRDKEFAIVKS